MCKSSFCWTLHLSSLSWKKGWLQLALNPIEGSVILQKQFCRRLLRWAAAYSSQAEHSGIWMATPVLFEAVGGYFCIAKLPGNWSLPEPITSAPHHPHMTLWKHSWCILTHVVTVFGSFKSKICWGFYWLLWGFLQLIIKDNRLFNKLLQCSHKFSFYQPTVFEPHCWEVDWHPHLENCSFKPLQKNGNFSSCTTCCWSGFLVFFPTFISEERKLCLNWCLVIWQGICFPASFMLYIIHL